MTEIEELREEIRNAHAAIKDLRHEIKEARLAEAAVKAAIPRMVFRQIKANVDHQLQNLHDEIELYQQNAYTEIGDRFNEMVDLLIKPYRKKTGTMDLLDQVLAKRYAAGDFPGWTKEAK